MVNINKLKGKMAEKGFSQLRLGEVAGISLSTVSQRFKNNGADFTVGEVGSPYDLKTLLCESSRASSTVLL